MRVSLSDLNLDPATTYGIDYYDLSNTSYATQAADVQMTIGNLCHVGQIPRTTYQILQSCPAEKNKANRLKEWREFVAGKGGAPIPKNSDLYIVRNGREIVPLVERELTKGDNLNSKSAIGLSFSPACAFRNPARGEKVTELCAQSLPVRFPPFAATITGGEVVVTRLSSGPASAYLVFIAQGQEAGRVTVRVEEKVVTLPGGSQPQVASPQAPGRVCSFGGRNYGAGETVVVFPSASVPFGQRCEGVSFFCRQPDPKKPLVSWHRAGNRRAEPQGGLDCRVEQPLCPLGRTPLEYALIDNDFDNFYVPAEAPPGKRSAVVCVPPRTKLPYTDVVNRKGYAISVEPSRIEDAQCDSDPLGLRRVRAEYVDSNHNDLFAHVDENERDICVTKDEGRLRREPEWAKPFIVGYRLHRRFAFNLPSERQESIPCDRGAPGSCSSSSTNSSESSEESSSSESSEESSSSSSSERGWDDPDPCKENPELCRQCGCRELTSHSYRVQVNITTFGGPSDSGVTSTERGSVDGLTLRSRDPKSELYTAWPLPSAEKLLGLPDTTECLGPEKESWEGEKIAAANEALRDYLVRITYVDPTGDYRTIDVPINDRGPGKATRWDASERLWRDLGVWKTDEDVKSTNPNDPAHMVELEIQLIPRNGVCP